MRPPPERPHLALFLSGVALGGVQRSTFRLTEALLAAGCRVDLVVPTSTGVLRDEVPGGARLVDIGRWWGRLPWISARKRRRVLAATPALAHYLRTVRPDAMIAASHYANLAALWARRMAGADTRLIVSQRTHLSRAIMNSGFPGGRRPLLAEMVARFYPLADGIVAVSEGVAEDLAAVAGLPRARITTIYNPVLSPELLRQAQAPLDHPWLCPAAPPLILGVGRLAPQKDFATLIRAFALLRAHRPARLLLLGEGRQRGALEALVHRLGLAGEVALPGFCANPFAWMARARVLALSSLYEGFGNVLVEALACGCPVVSTNCPSGPAEILEGGRFGRLVAVGDAEALAQALAHSLDHPPPPDLLRRRAALFSANRAAHQYLTLLHACGDRVRWVA
jgi:glycosyltransferase involved in cell wall biosynthesis